MRYLSSALAGLSGGLLSVIAVMTVKGLFAMKQADCSAHDCYVAVRVPELLIAFGGGFAAAFGWLLRRRRRLLGR